MIMLAALSSALIATARLAGPVSRYTSRALGQSRNVSSHVITRFNEAVGPNVTHLEVTPDAILSFKNDKCMQSLIKPDTDDKNLLLELQEYLKNTAPTASLDNSNPNHLIIPILGNPETPFHGNLAERALYLLKGPSYINPLGFRIPEIESLKWFHSDKLPPLDKPVMIESLLVRPSKSSNKTVSEEQLSELDRLFKSAIENEHDICAIQFSQNGLEVLKKTSSNVTIVIKKLEIFDTPHLLSPENVAKWLEATPLLQTFFSLKTDGSMSILSPSTYTAQFTTAAIQHKLDQARPEILGNLGFEA